MSKKYTIEPTSIPVSLTGQTVSFVVKPKIPVLPETSTGVSDIKLCLSMLQGTCAAAFKMGISKGSIVAALQELKDNWERWGN